MTLRTPRRRISPRTKRRYRAIREFFRKALGNTSQSKIKISSSIVNVTDLKHKIVGLEHQLNEVSKHCREISCLETDFRNASNQCHDCHEHPSCSKHDIDTIPEQTEHTTSATNNHRQTNSSTTKILYRNSETLTRKSEESDYAENCNCSNCNLGKAATPTMMNTDSQSAHVTRVKKKRSKYDDYLYTEECDPVLQRHRTQSAVENNCAYSTSNHSLRRPRASPRGSREHENSGPRTDRQHVKHREFINAAILEEGKSKRRKERKLNRPESPVRYDDGQGKTRKNKNHFQSLDQQFISDIIKRQYKPVKLFGRRESDVSQFSAPVCRDQEYPIRENIIEDADLCSCGRQTKHRSKYVCDYDVSDMRSICDTRLYSSKKYARPRHRKRHTEAYNDSELYDLIPVKEKSSPKSRRKFAEDNLVGYDYYREVPPSPRTLRPRLNLKAQQVLDYEDCNMIHVKQPEKIYIHQRPKRQQEYYVEDIESDITSEYVVVKTRKDKDKHKTKPAKVQANLQMQQETATISSLQNATIVSEPTHSHEHETSLNKTHDSVLSDKTDKALCEIKDILHNFLQEIKKDTSPQSSQSNAGNKSVPNATVGQAEEKGTTVSGGLPNGLKNFNYGHVLSPQCPTSGFMPQFTNPCCYPMMPICPMQNMRSMHNCTANGYRPPSGTCKCHAYTTTTRENICHDCSMNKTEPGMDTSFNMPTKRSETEELIKEIYKFVAQSPQTPRRQPRDRHREEQRRREEQEEKLLTSRSVGESLRMSRHDAKVGTPATKCYSKSCEAIGSRMASDTYYTSNTLSDTLLEKLSLEAATQSESELSTGYTDEKGKKGKFANKLRNFLFKKKKKDVIEELSESESSLEVDVQRRRARGKSPSPSLSPPRAPPFRQNVTNYMMHGEEYYRRPPIPMPYPPWHEEHYPHPYHSQHYDPRGHYCSPPPPVQELYSPHRVHEQTIREHAVAGRYPDPQYQHPHAHSHTPPQQYYDPHSVGVMPQVPLCLKEIEVKSTGTQSERKMSLFKKFAMRPQQSPTTRTEQPTMRSDQPTMRSAQSMMQERPKMFAGPAKHASPPQEKPGLLSGWKKLQAKAEAQARLQQLQKEQKQKLKMNYEDPMKYQMKTQNELAIGDEKMRNAMLKKLFYKRNPFSPNNLIIKTIMGRDPASFGEPNVTLRPRLFF